MTFSNLVYDVGTVATQLRKSGSRFCGNRLYLIKSEHYKLICFSLSDFFLGLKSDMAGFFFIFKELKSRPEKVKIKVHLSLMLH